MSKPKVGDIVLFKIDPTDFGIYRPLLVTFVGDSEEVEGEVFFNWERDKGREWPLRHLFFRLSRDQKSVEVIGVRPGEGVGEYKLRPSSEPSWYEEMCKRFEELEKQLQKPVAQAPRALVPEKRGKR